MRRRSRLAAVALLVTLLLAACDHDDGSYNGGDVVIPTTTYEPTTGPTYEPTYEPEPTATVAGSSDCPDAYEQSVALTSVNLQTRWNLLGVLACYDYDTGRLHLENESLVPWTLDSPLLRPPIPAPAGDNAMLVQLFREALAARAPSLLVIEPGESWNFPGTPQQLNLHVDPALSTLWQTYVGMKNASEGKVRDGFVRLVASRSASRQVATQCGLAAYDAVKYARSSGQQVLQNPTLYVVDSLGLTQQTRGCGAALQQLADTQPRKQVLLTADDLARELHAPQTSGVIDDVMRWGPKLLRRGH